MMRRVNDLSCRDWLILAKSVWKRNFGVGKGEYRARRLANPDCKPAVLCADYVRALSREGDLVVDPFAGTGGILLGAQMAGRRAIGSEVDPEQVKAYSVACEMMSDLYKTYDPHAVGTGNFFDLFPEPAEPYADLVMTDLPIFDLERRRTSSRRWRGQGGQPSGQPGFGDVSDWRNYIARMAGRCRGILKRGRYLAFFVEDTYADGRYVFLSEDARRAVEGCGFVPQGEWIWYNEARRVHIFGYPSRMMTSRIHVKVLFFTNGPLEGTT